MILTKRNISATTLPLLSASGSIALVLISPARRKFNLVLVQCLIPRSAILIAEKLPILG